MLHRKLIVAFTALALSACAQNVAVEEVKHISRDYPSIGDTPVSEALRCLVKFKSTTFVGVHNIADKTNRYTQDGEGAPLPISATEMMVTALGKTGIPLVNRHQTAVPEWEIKYAQKGILGDGKTQEVDGKSIRFRPIRKGSMRGSDLFITGAFNNLDWDTSSGGAELGVAGIGAGFRDYEMLVAADFQVWQTVSTELYRSDTIAKRIYGSEIKANLFRFFGDNLTDFNAGAQTNSPSQWASRYITEMAAWNIAKDILNADDSCDELLPQKRPQGNKMSGA